MTRIPELRRDTAAELTRGCRSDLGGCWLRSKYVPPETGVKADQVVRSGSDRW